jgi:hypothetical protein
MDVRLRDLREHQKGLYNLLLGLAIRCTQCVREWVQETLADEHSAETILRRWALKIENATDIVESVTHEVALILCAVQVFVEEIDKDFETPTSVRLLTGQLLLNKQNDKCKLTK